MTLVAVTRMVSLASEIANVANNVAALADNAAKAVGGIVAGIMNAANNAALLEERAKQAGMSIEEFQKEQGAIAIISKDEVQALKQVQQLFEDINVVKDKILAGIVKEFAPHIARLREGLKELVSNEKFLQMIKDLMKPISNILGIAIDIVAVIFKSKYVMRDIDSMFKSVQSKIEKLEKFMAALYIAVKGILYVLDLIVDISEIIKKKYSEICDGISKWLEEAVEEAIEYWTEFFTELDKEIVLLNEICEHIFKSIWEKIIAIKDGILEYIVYVKETFIQALNSIWEKIIAIKDAILEAVSKFGFIQAIAEKLGFAKNTVIKSQENITKAIHENKTSNLNTTSNSNTTNNITNNAGRTSSVANKNYDIDFNFYGPEPKMTKAEGEQLSSSLMRAIATAN
jgi:hypothetical protein